MSQPLLIGVDGGTESLRVGVYTLSGEELASASAAYETVFPASGQAEQNPEDWWRALCTALPEAMKKADAAAGDIAAITLDTTCCTVCFLDAKKRPLRPSLLWMDVRAGQQATQVLDTGDDALKINNGGHGPVSAEWMIPKSLWVKENQPALYDAAETVCEYQDYLNYRLTGIMTASANNTGVRWHFHHHAEGAPVSLLEKLGASELAQKWPQTVLAPGEIVGPLTQTAAQALHLNTSIPVVQGGADAFIAMAGMGVIRPGDLALVTGSSHLHLGVTDKPLYAKGMWGAYSDVLRRGSSVVEGGQTSTGSVINWFRRTLAPDASYHELDEEALSAPPGCDGVTAQDHFQGNRTPYTDAASRGAFTGLSLTHTRGHLFRALLESIAYGARLIIETMSDNGVPIENVVACGGVTRSPVWTQIHADIIGSPVKLAAAACAPALGSAMFGAIGAGHYDGLDEAAENMVRFKSTIEPNPSAHEAYHPYFERYKSAYGALRTIGSL
ncbi:MAG: carbohydrate kinase [Parvularcula sp.]|jgi:ribulokinase|nr:carbohydrate kinase [Parvularcula sp.]MCK5746450.1 carbohydrate kinase [Oricola sp.]